eukprot:8892846-Lingulodinium_polyedra.AAC.1
MVALLVWPLEAALSKGADFVCFALAAQPLEPAVHFRHILQWAEWEVIPTEAVSPARHFVLNKCRPPPQGRGGVAPVWGYDDCPP